MNGSSMRRREGFGCITSRGSVSREVIQEMQDEGIDFYRTDLYGTVTVTAQADGSFTVQTAKQPAEELAPAA